jgi:formylglycine-generating enzyme
MKKTIWFSTFFFIVPLLLFGSCGKKEKSPLGPKEIPQNYTIQGRVIEKNAGISGVLVHFTGSGLDTTATTSSTGSYTFTVISNGIFTLTPSKTGYSFTPPSIQVTVNGTDMTVSDFTSLKTHDEPGITFVSIPGGTFKMGDSQGEGSSDELPVHLVSVNGFKMSIFEITNKQYCAYLNAAKETGDITATVLSVTGARGDSSGQEYINLSGNFDAYNKCWITYSNNTFSVISARENWPVDYVTWYGAKAFALYYGLDLPTEAEWEYACRGGRQYRYGTDDGTLNTKKANYLDNGIVHPVDVGMYLQNPFGLYDMSGNVYEWCHDWYEQSYYSSSPAADPTGALSGVYRVCRGGSWGFSGGDCRSAVRGSALPSYSDGNVGFRVIRRYSAQSY